MVNINKNSFFIIKNLSITLFLSFSFLLISCKSTKVNKSNFDKKVINKDVAEKKIIASDKKPKKIKDGVKTKKLEQKDINKNTKPLKKVSKKKVKKKKVRKPKTKHKPKHRKKVKRKPVREQVNHPPQYVEQKYFRPPRPLRPPRKQFIAPRPSRRHSWQDGKYIWNGRYWEWFDGVWVLK